MGRVARRWVGWTGKALGTVLGLAVLVILVSVPRSPGSATAWSQLHPLMGVLGTAAGVSLTVGGLTAWWMVRPAAIGLAAAVAGLAWLAPELSGARFAADIWRAAAMLLIPMLLPGVAVAVVAADHPRASATARWSLALLVLATVILTIGRTITYRPFDDPTCWAFCAPAGNPMAIQGAEATPAYRTLTIAWGLLSLAGWAALAGRSAWSLRRQRSSRDVRLMLLAAVTLGCASAAWAALALGTRTDPLGPFGPLGSLPAVLWVVRGSSLMVLAAGIVGLVLLAVRRARALRAMTDAVEAMPAPGRLRDALARALGDPTIAVIYPVDGGARFVDAAGALVATPGASPGRAVTTIERGGTPIAIVEHVAGLEGPALVREIGAAARLVVDNERLRASVLARVADLRASQVRIVAVADEERRQLERDLHDGAQQRLLALSFEIRVALAAARAAVEPELAERLERADGLAQSAIAELRALAHGIHPAILRDTGLAPALATLSDDAPLPMELDVRFRGRCESTTEATAYHVVADALAEATRAGASHLAVRLERVEGVLVLEIDDDSPAPRVDRVRTADRVGAIGGRLDAVAGVAGVGRRIRAELPCG